MSATVPWKRQSSTYSANTSHGVVNATRAQTSLNDLETTTLAQDDVLQRHADVLEEDVTVAVRGIIVAKDTEHAVDGDAGGISWNEDDALLLVGAGVVLVRLAHGDVDLAARVTSTRGPPFLWKES